MSWLPLHTWRITLLDYSWLTSFLSALEKCCATHFWSQSFWWAWCPSSCFSPLRKALFFSPTVFKVFFPLSLLLRSLIMMFLGVHLFGFTLFEVHTDSWICKFMSFHKFRKISLILSSGTFSAQPPSLLLDAGDRNVRPFLQPNKRPRGFSFFSSVFFFAV